MRASEDWLRRGATLVALATTAFGAPEALAAERGSLDADYRAARRDAVVRAVESVGPAVVNISTQVLVSNPYSDRPRSILEWFFGGRRPRRGMVENSLGSGVIVDPKGYVLTNEHVISAADRILVTLEDERQVEAELVGSDRASDLAVLKLKEDGPWPHVDMGSSDDLLIGETVIAIGNPFGLQNTVTSGVVSALGRELAGPDGDRFADFIQTDAAINPGNSGGALLNINGELIGVNTQIVARGQNLGFAIPIDRARKVLDELILYGRVRPPWTGIVVETLDQRLAEATGASVSSGVIVVRRFGDSPAVEAGIRAGDVIVALDGTTVEDVADFQTALARAGKGARVRATVVRGEERRQKNLEVTTFPLERAPEMAWQILGLEVRDARRGVVVERVRSDSFLGRKGLPAGWYVLTFNGKRVEDARDFYEQIPEAVHRRDASLRITDGRRRYQVTVPLR